MSRAPAEDDIRRVCNELADMLVVQRGQRLSVQPVTRAEWCEVLKMAGYRGPASK